MKNKFFFITIAIFIIAFNSTAQVTGSFTDTRDGKTYKTVTIGTQTWMAENMNYQTSSSWCYKDSNNYCTSYGRLYTYESAKLACPTNWHIPTDNEWEILLTYLGGKDVAGGKLKLISTIKNINNDSIVSNGFSGLLCGYRLMNGIFDGKGIITYFWSSTVIKVNPDHVWAIGLVNDSNVLRRPYLKEYGFSIRCLKDL